MKKIHLIYVAVIVGLIVIIIWKEGNNDQKITEQKLIQKNLTDQIDSLLIVDKNRSKQINKKQDDIDKQIFQIDSLKRRYKKIPRNRHTDIRPDDRNRAIEIIASQE